MAEVNLVDHPLVQHKMVLRRKDTSTRSFRSLANEVSTLLAYEALRDIPTHDDHHRDTDGGRHRNDDRRQKLVFVSILRPAAAFWMEC